jgi:hypothetical protein
MSEVKGSSKDRKPAPGWLTIQQGYLMKPTSIVGIILIVLGIVSLAYFASPMRLLLKAVETAKQQSRAPNSLWASAHWRYRSLVCY